MSRFYTYPDTETLQKLEIVTPVYMRPNRIPYAAVITGYLTAEQCDAIVYHVTKTAEPYSLESCCATTRECFRPLQPQLDPIIKIGLQLNDMFWQYALDDEAQGGWMQTYSRGGNYHKHVDGSPGQSRKLTAVAMLSDPEDYVGGDLKLVDLYEDHTVEREQGTVVVFPPWLPHQVTEVFSGTRRTLNLGFWGPPFK